MNLEQPVIHQSMADLEAGMAQLLKAPRDGGVLESIVIRPDECESAT